MSTTRTSVDPFRFASPAAGSVDEAITFANANAYEWSYLDTCRENGVNPKRIPDGWPFAWLEHNRRRPKSRMEIRDAFRMWRDTGTLPGLDAA